MLYQMKDKKIVTLSEQFQNQISKR